MTAERAAAAWTELQRTAALVRVRDHGAPVADSNDNNTSSSRRGLRALALLATTVAAAAATAQLGNHTVTAAADASADQDLFALTNQDRASNGVHALVWHSTLGAIGESKPYSGCGFTVYGRSYDMIQRNYFAHPILNCGGQLVFNMMNAAGIPYRSAGENIGWTSGAGDAASSASYINQQFMNSTEHRDNILNPNYTHLGIGSDLSPPGDTWTGTSPGMQNVWMFSEEFAQLPSSAPAPAPRPAPRPTSSAKAQPQSTPPPPAQTAAPQPTAVATVVPTPTPSPTPLVTPVPVAPLDLGAPELPLVWNGGGLLSDSIEAVLEAFLVD